MAALKNHDKTPKHTPPNNTTNRLLKFHKDLLTIFIFLFQTSTSILNSPINTNSYLQSFLYEINKNKFVNEVRKKLIFLYISQMNQVEMEEFR